MNKVGHGKDRENDATNLNMTIELQNRRIGWAVFKDWSRRGRIFFIGIIFAVLVFIATAYFPAEGYGIFKAAPATLADRVRWAGMIFQVSGVLTIVFALRDHLLLFGEGSMLRGLINWLADIRFVVIKRPPISAAGVAMSGVATMKASAVVVPSNQGTVDEQIERLRKMIVGIQGDMNAIYSRIDNDKDEMKKWFAEGFQELKKADLDLDKKLRSATIGGIKLQLVGIVFLLVGVLLTSIPDGIAYCFGKVVL